MSIKAPFVRNPYNYDTKLASVDSGLFCEDESLTVQAEKDDADINVIVKRFGLTGVLPQAYRPPVAGDFTGINDYQTALNAIIAADDAFMEMPAELRARFKNDPVELMSFLEDVSNRDEAISLGLIKAPSKPSEPPLAVTPPVPAPTAS